MLFWFFLQIPAVELLFCENLASNLRPWSVSGLRLWHMDLTNTFFPAPQFLTTSLYGSPDLASASCNATISRVVLLIHAGLT